MQVHINASNDEACYDPTSKYTAFTLTSKFCPDISSLGKFFLILKMKKYGKFPLDNSLLFLQLMTLLATTAEAVHYHEQDKQQMSL